MRNLHVNRVRHAFCVPSGLNPTSVKPVMPHMWPPRVPHRVAWLIPLQPAIFTYSRGLVGWDWVCDWRGGFSWDAGVRALQGPHFICESSCFSLCGLFPALCPVHFAHWTLPTVPCTLFSVLGPRPLRASIGELVTLALLLSFIGELGTLALLLGTQWRDML